MSHGEFEQLYSEGVVGFMVRSNWFQIPPANYTPLTNCPVCGITPDGVIVKLRLPSFTHSPKSGLRYKPPVCSKCTSNSTTLF